ncbi:hypothetical protein O8I50_07560 [Campylobacter lari]|uniref:hypothetical protein n=1 Tax=Campylobacter lari TaxID=201 RepID=UPI0008B3DF7D|nr:hypothetical protein [Campylobacter lari]EDP6897635.1 hypothetical protein [Campylobacter lari]EFO9431267.1 hypothetical protein [Campylobacter lari]EFV1127145.1 hypothetical protein [Campylobacter lari]EGK0994098.1 hypothetical protein [Campylobacter lari]EIE3558025.1 hypothetical protein [Campylobacter lari]
MTKNEIVLELTKKLLEYLPLDVTQDDGYTNKQPQDLAKELSNIYNTIFETIKYDN